MDYKKKYDEWRKSPRVSDELKKELKAIKGDKDEIRERFKGELEFGTGGLRGLVGAGTTRLNVHTVCRATQGLADIIRKKKPDAPAVAVAYDSRHLSGTFALEASLVLAANGIKAYLFESLRPTPELSFAVRHLGCHAGIVITASHNPPEYNGYKVYGPDGGQITRKVANKITDAIDKLDLFEDIKSLSEKKARKQGLLVTIGETVDQAYMDAVTGLDACRQAGHDTLRVVYTPLHGAGLMPVTAVLEKLGYRNVFVVESQADPDGGFPTVKTPDPSDIAVFDEAIKLAAAQSANIILATDPDCDRLGVAARDKSGGYTVLGGSEIGALLTHYVLSSKKNVTRRDAVVKTIVTSELGAAIAEDLGASVFNTLTGFKYIGEMIGEFERGGQNDFAFGYEESCGYLTGTFVRDKDAVVAAALICDMASFYLNRGLTLFDALDRLSREYGYYSDELISYTVKGAPGGEQIQKLFGRLRSEPLKGLFDDMMTIEDYACCKRLNVQTGQTVPIALPASDVVKVIFTDGSWFAVRPSGTEPKLKLYFSGRGTSYAVAADRVQTVRDSVLRYLGGPDKVKAPEAY